MGPIRGSVTTLAMAVMATPVWAQVCDKERPAWTPGQGAMTVQGEIWRSLSQPGLVTVLVLCLVVAALTIRSLRVSLAVAALCLLWVGYGWFGRDPMLLAAQSEGCVGPNLGLLALPCALLVLSLVAVVTARRTGRLGES